MGTGHKGTEVELSWKYLKVPEVELSWKYLSTVPEGAVQATCWERRAITSLFWL